MKIIDILVKKANGTLEDGFKFWYRADSYTYRKSDDSIFQDGFVKKLGEKFVLDNCLNDEVEIIEKDKEIEEFDVVGCNIEVGGAIIPTENLINDYIIDKINELVRAVNKLQSNKQTQ